METARPVLPEVDPVVLVDPEALVVPEVDPDPMVLPPEVDPLPASLPHWEDLRELSREYSKACCRKI
jgi:hypothetical protein